MAVAARLNPFLCAVVEVELGVLEAVSDTGEDEAKDGIGELAANLVKRMVALLDDEADGEAGSMTSSHILPTAFRVAVQNGLVQAIAHM